MKNAPHFYPLWAWMFCDFLTEILTEIFVVCANKLILPFKTGGKALSVTFGDSSPRGRAKASACNCAIGHNSIRNGARLYRYAPLTVLRTPRVFSAVFFALKYFAESAPAGAKRIGLRFPGGVCVGGKPSRPAAVRAAASRCPPRQAPQRSVVCLKRQP